MPIYSLVLRLQRFGLCFFDEVTRALRNCGLDYVAIKYLYVYELSISH